MNTNTNTNTKTARIVPRILLGILAGSRSISVRTDTKTGKTSRREILSNWHCEVYFVNSNGETVKHCPLAHFTRSLDIPTGTRDNMIIWTLETARRLNFGVKSYIIRDYLTARKNVLGRMEKRLARLEKTVNAGKQSFMDKASANAAAAWDNIPDAISSLKIDIAAYSRETV